MTVKFSDHIEISKYGTASDIINLLVSVGYKIIPKESYYDYNYMSASLSNYAYDHALKITLTEAIKDNEVKVYIEYFIDGYKVKDFSETSIGEVEMKVFDSDNNIHYNETHINSYNHLNDYINSIL
jgi:hypothetical protein